MVSLLLDEARGTIDVNKARDDGCTPLFMACQKGLDKVVAVLLDKARDTIDVNKPETDNNCSPLLVACAAGCASVVAQLLARSDINVNLAGQPTLAHTHAHTCIHMHACVLKVVCTQCA